MCVVVGDVCAVLANGARCGDGVWGSGCDEREGGAPRLLHNQDRFHSAAL
jgi:hypothetical protein